MSQKLWKSIRREQREMFRYAHDKWLASEPRPIRFIAHYKWKKSEPKFDDYVGV